MLRLSSCYRFTFFFFSSRRRHTRCSRDWSSDVCSSDLIAIERGTLRIADSRINAIGDIRGWRGVPRIQAVVESPSLDLALLIPEGERSPVRGAMEAISGKAKLAATASGKHARYPGVPFDEVQATVNGADGV